MRLGTYADLQQPAARTYTHKILRDCKRHSEATRRLDFSVSIKALRNKSRRKMARITSPVTESSLNPPAVPVFLRLPPPWDWKTRYHFWTNPPTPHQPCWERRPIDTFLWRWDIPPADATCKHPRLAARQAKKISGKAFSDRRIFGSRTMREYLSEISKSWWGSMRLNPVEAALRLCRGRGIKKNFNPPSAHAFPSTCCSPVCLKIYSRGHCLSQVISITFLRHVW